MVSDPPAVTEVEVLTGDHPGRRTSRSGREHEVRALDVADVALRVPTAALDPAEPGDLLLQGVELVGGLAGVSEAGEALARLRSRDVHVVRGGEVDGVLAVRDLVVVK